MKKVTMKKTLLASMMVIVSAGAALADFNMKAGPIWNQADAETKCPVACSVSWNGNWTTVQEGSMSICSVQNNAPDGQSYVIGDATQGLEAGPIWNNDDAKGKCNAESPRVYWRVNLSKDEPHGTEKNSPEVHS